MNFRLDYLLHIQKYQFRNYKIFSKNRINVANFAVNKDENLFMLKIPNIKALEISGIKEQRDSQILDLYRNGYDIQNDTPFGVLSFSSLENTSINMQVPIIYPDTLMIIGLGIEMKKQ